MKSPHTTEQGMTLLVGLALLAIVAVLVGVALAATTHQSRTAKRDGDFKSAEAAAEGALEYAYASWKEIIRGNGLRPPANRQTNATNLPPPTSTLNPAFQAKGITFSNFSVVNANQWGETTDSANVTITDPVQVAVSNVPGFPGWGGVASYCRAQVTASDPSIGQPVSVTLARHFQVTAVSILQAAIFFDYDIELHPGPPMTINGLVHTNGDLWVATGSANTLQFNANVSYVGNYHEQYKPNILYGGGQPPPPNPPLWSDGLPSGTSTRYGMQLCRVDRLDPYGTESSSLFDTTDTNTNNDSMREIIEVPNTAQTDPPQIQATRLYSQAGVRITIDRSHPAGNPTGILIKNGSDLDLPAATETAIRNAITANATTIHDYREAADVSLYNLDMKRIDTALTAMGSTFNGILYVQDTSPSPPPNFRNAIRLQNGAVLSNDLTVASNNAVYVQGDFNTGGVTAGVHDPLLVPSNLNGNPTNTDSPVALGYSKKSAAIAADAVMILSNSWLDANSSQNVTLRVASHTTVNAAIIGGIVPSNLNNNGRYSGGPHNFPRFLETWSGKDLTYWGSMVQLYFSQQFNGAFDTGNVYSPPGRRWNYDAQLGTRPPPGLLRNIQYSRGRWQRF